MKSTHSRKALLASLGTALVSGALITPTQAHDSPFGMHELNSGYMQVAEGSCGEGKCGAGMMGNDATPATTLSKPKTTPEGKCSPGMVDKKANMEGKCSGPKCVTDKCVDGKCGTEKCVTKCTDGTCGGNMKGSMSGAPAASPAKPATPAAPVKK